MNTFKGTPGEWSQGRLLNTSITNQWNDEERKRAHSAERLLVVANFNGEDEGRSRKRVVICNCPEDAQLIAASKQMMEALQATQLLLLKIDGNTSEGEINNTLCLVNAALLAALD